MVKVDYFIFCESKAVSEDSKISLQNLFDKVYATSFPAAQRPFKAVVRIEPVTKPLVDAELQIAITATLKGTEIAKLEGTLTGTVELGNALAPDFDLSPFVFPEAGDYVFAFSVGGKVLASRTLQVRSADELEEA